MLADRLPADTSPHTSAESFPDDDTDRILSTDIPGGGGPAFNVPAELRGLGQWVGWKKVPRDGKVAKVPVNPWTGGPASSTDFKTWAGFSQTLAGAQAGRWDGIGLVFNSGDPYVGIDLDDVIDAASGEIDPEAAATVERFGSYAELSPSGTGIHIIVRGELPPGGRKRGDRECYSEGRFFTVTGKPFAALPIAEAGPELARWHAETFPAVEKVSEPAAPRRPLGLNDQELLAKIAGSKQADKFARLWVGDTAEYGSGSEADLALCSLLAWWTNRDAAAVDRLFRCSGLMRPKWDAKRADSTYGARTVARAVDTTRDGYDPNHTSGPVAKLGGTAKPAVSPLVPAEAGGLLVEPLAGIRPELVQWLVPGKIPAGMLGLLAGDGGHGKSMSTLELAAAVSAGRCPFGLTYPDPVHGKVLLISCEDDWAKTIVPRLIGLGADLSRVLRVKGMKVNKQGTSDFHMGHYRELAALLHADPAIRLVVIDPAGAYIGRAEVNENRDADLRAVLGPMSDTANATGVAILLVKHLNKSANASAVQRVSGSTGYVNAVRYAYMIAPDEQDRDRKLFMRIKANILPPQGGDMAYRLMPYPDGEAEGVMLDACPDLSRAELDGFAKQLFRQVWEHDIQTDPDEVVRGSGGRKTNKADAAADFLAPYFAEVYVAYPSEQIMQRLSGRFGRDSVYAAKDILRERIGLEWVRSVRTGNRWCWGVGSSQLWQVRDFPEPGSSGSSGSSL